MSSIAMYMNDFDLGARIFFLDRLSTFSIFHDAVRVICHHNITSIILLPTTYQYSTAFLTKSKILSILLHTYIFPAKTLFFHCKYNDISIKQVDNVFFISCLRLIYFQMIKHMFMKTQYTSISYCKIILLNNVVTNNS